MEKIEIDQSHHKNIFFPFFRVIIEYFISEKGLLIVFAMYKIFLNKLCIFIKKFLLYSNFNRDFIIY